MMFKQTAGGQTILAFIFSGKWDRGINLFSINAGVIVTVITAISLFLIKKLLTFLGKSIGAKGMTLSSIAVSVLSFLALFFVILYSLYQFGVNTTAPCAVEGLSSLLFTKRMRYPEGYLILLAES